MTREVEGCTIRAYLGIVTGEATTRVAHSGTRRRSNDTEARVHAARYQAVANMVQHALEVRAEAIVGVAVESSSIHRPGGGILIVSVASGTAVLLEQIDE